VNKTSVKLSNEGIEFLKRLRTNRRKIEIDKEDLPYWKLLETIQKFFKIDNESYLRLVQMEVKK